MDTANVSVNLGGIVFHCWPRKCANIMFLEHIDRLVIGQVFGALTGGVV